MVINVKDITKTIYGTLLCVSADNLASQLIGGYKQLASALKKCRFCYAEDNDVQTKVYICIMYRESKILIYIYKPRNRHLFLTTACINVIRCTSIVSMHIHSSMQRISHNTQGQHTIVTVIYWNFAGRIIKDRQLPKT